MMKRIREAVAVAKRFIIGAFVIGSCVLNSTQSTAYPQYPGFLDDDQFRQHILNTAQMVLNHTAWETAWLENLRYSTENQDLGLTYTCQFSPSTSIPTSVHELRPGDIKFVAALGGSVTSGFALGANYVVEILDEHRGESWSAGGDGLLHGRSDLQYEEYGIVTIPNLLKQFNADVLGYSSESGDVDSENARLNRAWSGAMAKDLLSQADDLIAEMNVAEGMEYGFSWKLLTVFIGLHDTCHACNDQDSLSAEMYIRHLEEALDRLSVVPRMLVNLVPVYNLQELGRLTDNIFCEDLISLICPCALTAEGSEFIRATQKQYYEAMKQLVDTHKYDVDKTFTVVLQPHLTNVNFPINIQTSGQTQTVDKSFVGADCFSPNLRGQKMLAYMLWNTMLTPVNNKVTRYNYTEGLELLCPSASHPFIFTYNNSVGVEWPPTGGDDDGSEREDYTVTATVTTLACVLVLVIIVGILIASFCKKNKRTEDDVVLKRPDTPQLPIGYMTYDNPGEDEDRIDLADGLRRGSNDSVFYQPGSRRPSADVASHYSNGSRRGSLEPSAAHMLSTSLLSKPGLYIRRGSEDLRRDILMNTYHGKRRTSEGSLQVASHLSSTPPPFHFSSSMRDMSSLPEERFAPPPPKKVTIRTPDEIAADESVSTEASNGISTPSSSIKIPLRRNSMDTLDEIAC